MVIPEIANSILDKITLEATSKRYIKEWVFRNLSYTFERNQAYVILGSNGSGKSTLLQVAASVLSPSTGKVSYYLNGEELPEEARYKHISLATPYMELPEEFTLSKVIDFHLKFKSFYSGIDKEKFIEICYLTEAKDKIVRNFSSGMKQRLKLGLAILSESSTLFLDEPSSNLDEKGIEWFGELIEQYKEDRIIIVCSNNIVKEYFFCQQQVQIEDFKNR